MMTPWQNEAGRGVMKPTLGATKSGMEIDRFYFVESDGGDLS